MTIHHVETQEDYDALMVELEEKGHRWLSGYKPTEYNYWEIHKEDSCINILSKYITFIDIEQCKKQYPYTLIIEYKAKGEIKQNIIDWATDVFVAVGLFARYIKFEMKKSTVEADLKEAKSSAKKLIENIDKYLKSVNPKFKKGDIVASKIFTDDSLSFIQLNQDLNNWCNSVDGFWYIKRDYKVYDRSIGVFKEDTRHATTEEIAEYKVALNFHKHGRKPFEVKEGDLIKYPTGQNIMIYHPDCFSKADFLNDEFKLLKTAEEVNEWLENK